MRDSLANALRARDNTGIEQARETIHAASIEYATAVRSAKKTSSENEQMATILDQSEGVLTRSGMMNAESFIPWNQLHADTGARLAPAIPRSLRRRRR